MPQKKFCSQPCFFSRYRICTFIWLFTEAKPCNKHWRVFCQFHKPNQFIKVFHELQRRCEKWAGTVQQSAAKRGKSRGGSKLLVLWRMTSCSCKTACASTIKGMIQLSWVSTQGARTGSFFFISNDSLNASQTTIFFHYASDSSSI